METAGVREDGTQEPEKRRVQGQGFEKWGADRQIADLLWLRLYQRCHGLAPVLGALDFVIGDYHGSFETDGRRLYLDAERLKEEFREGSEPLCLELLHMIGHCLLCHPFAQNAGAEAEGGPSWAEGRADVGVSGERKLGRMEQEAVLDLAAWELAGQIWGEPLSVLQEAKKEADSRTRSALLYVDSHENWGRRQSLARLARASGRSGNGGADGDECDRESRETSARWWEEQREALAREAGGGKRRIGMAKKREAVRCLVPAAGHRGDYREFLKSFSSFREEGRTNPEEFQYAWYLYGMQEYGNMPLIEPLEYREERKVEDLAIVIDTSASCRRELVQVFLEETRGILEQERLFFDRFCLHIIQCDNQVQRDDRIGSREEFEEYLEELAIQGGGGTDFGPAFAYIERLREAGEFRDLKGLLYFTDGSGLYPKEEPGYAVYFVMLKGRYDAIDMPEWVRSIILEEREGV